MANPFLIVKGSNNSDSRLDQLLDPTGTIRSQYISLSLSDISNVNITTPTLDQILKYDSVTEKWINSDSALTEVKLIDLDDVTISNTPQNNDILKYSTSQGCWVNATNNLSDISDVTITNPSSNHFLVYDEISGKWINVAKNIVNELISLIDVNINTLADTQVLISNSNLWINVDFKLSSLGDVTISNLSNNQILKYDTNDSKWKNATLSTSSTLATLTDCSISNPVAQQILQYNSVSQKWENKTSQLSQSLYTPTDGDSIVYNTNACIIATSTGIYLSFDLVNWALLNNTITTGRQMLYYNNILYVATAAGAIYSSADGGFTYTNLNSNLSSILLPNQDTRGSILIRAFDKFYIVGTAVTHPIAHSTDCITWTGVGFNSRTLGTSIAYNGNKMFVVVCDAAYANINLIYTTDETNYTEITGVGSFAGLSHIFGNGNIWIFSRGNGTTTQYLSSDNGATFSVRGASYFCTYSSYYGMYLASGGGDNTPLTVKSTDASTWTAISAQNLLLTYPRYFLSIRDKLIFPPLPSDNTTYYCISMNFNDVIPCAASGTIYMAIVAPVNTFSNTRNSVRTMQDINATSLTHRRVLSYDSFVGLYVNRYIHTMHKMISVTSNYSVTKDDNNIVYVTYIFVRTNALTITLPTAPELGTYITISTDAGGVANFSVTKASSDKWYDKTVSNTKSSLSLTYGFCYTTAGWMSTYHGDYMVINSQTNELLCDTSATAPRFKLNYTNVVIPHGHVIVIKDNGSAATRNISIVSSTASIDGSSTYTISANYGLVRITYDKVGNTWYIV